VLATEGLIAAPDSTPERGYYYRSDHFSFAKRGVPMFYVEAGEDLVTGGKEAGRAFGDDYTQNRYHGPGDEYSGDWDWSGIAQDLRLFYRLGRDMAQSKDWPNWYEGDEFRAIRDKSCAGDEGGC
jgi:Zn-dependent M28 family amino/carboxypeptidase